MAGSHRNTSPYSEHPDSKVERNLKNGNLSILPPIQNNAYFHNGTNGGTVHLPVQNGGYHSDEPPKQVKPLWFCSLITRRYKLMFAITLSMHIFLVVLTLILVVAGYNIFPVEFQQTPINIRDSKHFLRQQAWINRDESDDLLDKNTSSYVIGERSRYADRLQIMFEDDDNLLTSERLKAMKKIEDKIIGQKKFKDFCKLDYTLSVPECEKPQSLIRLFDGTYQNEGLYDPDFNNIQDTMFKAYNNNQGRALILPLVGKDSTFQENKVFISLVRFYVPFGYPYKGFNMKKDDRKDMDKKLEEFQSDNYGGYLEDLAEDGVEGMDVLYTSNQLRLAAILPEITKGMILAASALIFIYILLIFHTSSLLLASLALMSIITSFCGTNLLYNLIYQYRYFGLFHVLGVFIILGIGADDVFVFVDAWRAAGHEGYTDTAQRLTVSYRRASKSMLITSFTTFIAFLSNAFNPLLMTSSFSVFAATLVIFNYLSVIIFFPCLLILHHYHWANKTWPCFRCCKTEKPGEQEGIVVRFFKGPFCNFVTHKYLRFLIILASLGVLVGFIVSATNVVTAKGEIQIFKNDNNFQKASNKESGSFLSISNNDVEVVFVWGMKKQDYDGCDPKGVGCKGETVWDDNFNANPDLAQTEWLKLCETLKNMDEEQAKKLRARKNELTGEREIKCFLGDMNDFMTKDNDSISLPFNSANMGQASPFLNNNLDLYNRSVFTPSFNRYFETASLYWINNRYAEGEATEDYREYSDYLGHVRNPGTTYKILKQTSSDNEFLYGTRLRYAGISIKTTLNPFATGFEEGLDIVDAWEEYVETLKTDLPDSMKDFFHCTPIGEWGWYEIQEVLAESAIQGVVIGVCLAFVVLTLATMNVVIGFVATLDIACVTASVIGLIPMAGWELGVIESLNLALVVGLSVDYVVHLAEAYHDSKSEDRVEKVRDMLSRVGVSILFGAITTLGSSLFMVFAELQFYYEFGLFIFATIGFSLFYALFLFTPVMALIGPTGNFGSLTPIWHWIKSKCGCCSCCQVRQSSA